MKNVRLIVVGLLCFFAMGAFANEVHILCPEPNAVTFHLNNSGRTSDRFEAQGYANVTQGNLPAFNMTIFTDKNLPPTEMYGASYIYDGTFICNYFGKNGEERHAFPLIYGDLRTEFPGGCYFKINHRHECSGNVQDCELVCLR